MTGRAAAKGSSAPGSNTPRACNRLTQEGVSMSYPLDRKLAVEFVGMFMFVFTVGMATNKISTQR
jgi:hypothetical protein